MKNFEPVCREMGAGKILEDMESNPLSHSIQTVVRELRLKKGQISYKVQRMGVALRAWHQAGTRRLKRCSGFYHKPGLPNAIRQLTIVGRKVKD